MGALFGEEFRQRVDLQRRQVYHQELLDSARFGQAGTSEEVVIEPLDPSTGSKGVLSSGPVSVVLWALAVLFFAFTIPAAILSGALALPVAWILMSCARALTRRSVDSYGGFYRSALSGVFAYLTVTTFVVVLYAVLEAPHSNAGIVADFGAVLSPQALGFRHGMLMLIPGLFVCAAIWSRQIGSPFNGWKGYLRAMTLATLLVSTLMAVVSYSLVRALS